MTAAILPGRHSNKKNFIIPIPDAYVTFGLSIRKKKPNAFSIKRGKRFLAFLVIFCQYFFTKRHDIYLKEY